MPILIGYIKKKKNEIVSYSEICRINRYRKTGVIVTKKMSTPSLSSSSFDLFCCLLVELLVEMKVSTLMKIVSPADRQAIVSVLGSTSTVSPAQAKTCAKVAQRQLIQLAVFDLFNHVSEPPEDLRQRFTELGLDIFALTSLPTYLAYPSKLSILAGTEVEPEEIVVAGDLLVPTLTDAPEPVSFNAFKTSSCRGKDKVTHMKSIVTSSEVESHVMALLEEKCGNSSTTWSKLTEGYGTYTTLLRLYQCVASPNKHIHEVTFIQPWVRAILQFVANTCSVDVDALKWKDYIQLSSRVQTEKGDTIITGLPDLEIVNRGHASDEVEKNNLREARMKLNRLSLSERGKARSKNEVVTCSAALRDCVLNILRLRGIVEVKVPRLIPTDPNSINTSSQDQTCAQLISLQDFHQGAAVFALLTDGFSGSIMVLEGNSGKGHTFYRTRTARTEKEMLTFFVLAMLLTADELLSFLKRSAVDIDLDDDTNIAE